MTPHDFIFSEAATLDGLDMIAARVLPHAELPEYPWAGLPSENSLAFEGRANLSTSAFYRLRDGNLEIASLFGACQLNLAGIDATRAIGLLCLRQGVRVASWKVKADGDWRDSRGGRPAEGVWKAKILPGGAFEPIHWDQSFRGIDSKPDFWTVVLLPSLPSRVHAKEGCARIEAGGREFALPSGPASDDVLAGGRRAQWGLPDESGFFVLQPR